MGIAVEDQPRKRSWAESSAIQKRAPCTQQTLEWRIWTRAQALLDSMSAKGRECKVRSRDLRRSVCTLHGRSL